MQAQEHTTGDLEGPSARAAVREGSRHVDDAFIREHQRFVRRCLLRFGIAGADVDDAVQDVFVVALRHEGPFDVNRSVRPWLYTVALHVSRNARRKRSRTETLMADLPEVHVPPSQEQHLHASEARSLVHRALDELPPAQRDVVLLHRLEGWPMEMVAETVGCPVATAHSRLRLGSARLDRAVRRHALRARCAALLAAFLGAFAAPPVAAAATTAVVLVVIGAAVILPRSESSVEDRAPRAATPSVPTLTAARSTTSPGSPAAAASVEVARTTPSESRSTNPERHGVRSRATTEPRAPAPPPAAPPEAPAPVTPAPREAVTEPTEDGLLQETRMLARARTLVSTSPRAARQALDAYDARFPEGQLHRERAAIERALAADPP